MRLLRSGAVTNNRPSSRLRRLSMLNLFQDDPYYQQPEYAQEVPSNTYEEDQSWRQQMLGRFDQMEGRIDRIDDNLQTLQDT